MRLVQRPLDVHGYPLRPLGEQAYNLFYSWDVLRNSRREQGAKIQRFAGNPMTPDAIYQRVLSRYLDIRKIDKIGYVGRSNIVAQPEQTIKNDFTPEQENRVDSRKSLSF
jgi:hypothetical protein